jgi:hypothetical protein
MNYRLQLSPISGSRESQVDLRSGEGRHGQPTNWEDAKFFRSWLVYNSNLELQRVGINWNVVLGLGAAVILSISFCVAAGVMIARLWQ